MDPLFGEALVHGRAGALASLRDHELTAILARIDDERIGPLLQFALTRTGEIGRCPARLQGHLRRSAHAAAAACLVQDAELARLVSALIEHRVTPFLLKGAALAHTLYPNPALRVREDTDILLRNEELMRAREALQALGYARVVEQRGSLATQQEHHERVVGGVRHACDVHLRPFNPRVFSDVIVVDTLIESGCDIARLPGARQPSLAHTLLLAAMHRIAHHDGRDELLWLMDIKLVCDRLDHAEFERIGSLAIAGRVARVVCAALERSKDALNAAVPDELLARLDAAGRGEPSARFLAANLLPSDVLWMDLKTLSSWTLRVRLVAEHLFPPRDYIASKYGATTRTAVAFAYVKRIVRGAPSWLRHDPPAALPQSRRGA